MYKHPAQGGHGSIHTKSHASNAQPRHTKPPPPRTPASRSSHTGGLNKSPGVAGIESVLNALKNVQPPTPKLPSATPPTKPPPPRGLPAGMTKGPAPGTSGAAAAFNAVKETLLATKDQVPQDFAYAATGNNRWGEQWHEVATHEKDGKICKDFVETLIPGTTNRQPKTKTDCKDKTFWDNVSDLVTFSKNSATQQEQDQGKWTETKSLGTYKTWGSEACHSANVKWGGQYTWWGQNGYDVDTSLEAHKGSQGMLDAPLKIPQKKDAAEKLGPAAYSLHYTYNAGTKQCERAVEATPWLRDALLCTGNIGSVCDLGYSAASEVAKKYEAYKAEKETTGRANQAWEDFFGAAEPVLEQRKENEKNCSQDGWWDRKMCGVGQSLDWSKDILIIGGIVAVVVMLKM